MTFSLCSILSDENKTTISHTQQWKQDKWRLMRQNVQSIVASTKMTPQEPKKAKEASLYPSNHIWRQSESISNARSINHQ